MTMLNPTRMRWFAAIAVALVMSVGFSATAMAQQEQPMDFDITSTVSSQLTQDNAVDGYKITTRTTDGVVTLTGEVNNVLAKDRAVRLAEAVRGVKGVTNNIHIDYSDTRSDSEIRAEIEGALRWNALVDDAMIDVAVNNGEATLSGTVGSAAEKRLARDDAFVVGVRTVNAEDLTVARWARDEDLRKAKYIDRSDDEIANAVNDALLYDPRVSSFKIDVSADNGVVALSGAVDNLAAKRAAAQDARNTVGVWRVKNNVIVRDEQYTDAEIERHIEDALLRNATVNRFDVTVNVIDGEAILTGSVDSYFEKMEADSVASTVQGVREVSNRLNVEYDYDPLTYDPYVDDAYPYDYDWYTPPTTASTWHNDWEIRQDIQDELFWSPFVNSEEITVTVDDAKATLTGTVDTWSERQAASENAIEGGAVSVDNNLMVDYGPDYYREDTAGE